MANYQAPPTILDFDRQPLADALEEADPGILDGRGVAAALRSRLEPIAGQMRRRDIEPTLAVVQVGDDEASSIYIRHKLEACEQLGIRGRHDHLSADITDEELIDRLRRLNDDPGIHGILLQLPLPAGVDENRAMHEISPRKDADGFHPVNLGSLVARRSLLEPCTPTGIATLLEAADIDVVGKDAVVVGRSVIVGRPVASMLARCDATVTLCHRHTRDLDQKVGQADIVVVATGVPELVQGDWIKEGAVVVDVGISRVDGKLVGDVEFDEAVDRASWITPVPGGVGPMTVATVLENTLRASCIQHELVVRDGEVVDADDAGVRYQTTGNLEITRLTSCQT